MADSDPLEVVEAVASTPEGERHDIVVTAVADSVKTLRKFAMWGMVAIVLIVLVGMIAFVHAQGTDHGTTQHTLTGIQNTLNGDKQAIINSCKVATGK